MKKAAVIAVAIALAAFLWPLVFIDRSAGDDWAYFDSLSLIVRSSVLHYHRFPLHDPWVLGGVDILGNPQSRVFSPLGLLDLVFLPQTANVLSLVIYGAFGALGMIQLLKHLGHDELLASAGGCMFISGSWFMLHYAEGHVTFGAMQTLPWVVLALLRVNERRMQVMLAALFALFLVDGAVYMLIYSIYAGIVLAAVKLMPLRKLAVSVRSNKVFALAMLVSALAVGAAKVVPVIGMLGERAPTTESTDLPAGLVVRGFFAPLQWFNDMPPDSPWRFHEIGCYAGVFALLVVLNAMRDRDFREAHARWFIFAAVFLWIGTDFLAPLNPWEIFKRLPFLQQAHVQSRLFVLFWLAWVVITCGALRLFVRYRNVAVFAVLAEIVLVAQLGWFVAMQSHPDGSVPWNTRLLVTETRWQAPKWFGQKPDLYFDGGHGHDDTYEPAKPQRALAYKGARDLKREISPDDPNARVDLIEVTPGRVTFDYQNGKPTRVRLRLNRLMGWRAEQGLATPVTTEGALAMQVEQSGRIVLGYHPWYWPWLAWVYLAGVLGLAVCARQAMKT